MGLSGRPKFPNIRIKGDPQTPANIKHRVQQAEAFFLDSFEDFAQHEKLNKFTMIGHSLGGYLSTAYALKHPQRINKLVLVSPVGIPKSPYMSEAEEVEKAESGVDRELNDNQLDSTTPSASTESAKPKQPQTSIWTRLWEANISPFSVVRLSTFAGPKLVSRYAARRFALFAPEVQSELFNYLYCVYGQRGSGEYCLAHLLSPGAYARAPLVDRLAELDAKIPVSFIYGDSDWMDKNGGIEAVRRFKARKDASDLMKRRSKGVFLWQFAIPLHAAHTDVLQCLCQMPVSPYQRPCWPLDVPRVRSLYRPALKMLTSDHCPQ